jgi:WD40 repeat protein
MPPQAFPIFQCHRTITPEGGIHCAAVSPDAKIIVIAGEGAKKMIWSLETDELLRELQYELPRRVGASPAAIAISPDGQKAAFVGVSYGRTSDEKDYVINVWHTQTGKHLFSDSTHDECWFPEYNAVAFCADSLTLLAGGTRLDSWNLRTKQMRDYGDCGSRLAISLNNRLVHSYLSRLWFNTVPLQYPVHEMEPMPAVIGSVAITTNGGICAAGLHDGSLHLWRWDTYQKLHTLESVHSNSVCRLAFSPDGKWLVSGSVDQPLKVWDVKTAALLAELPEHKGYVQELSFSRDGRTLVSVNFSAVRVWQVGS